MIKLPKNIKFVITDFDGIITDNCVYIDEKGNMSRKLNFKDIMAFSLLKKNGYNVAIISGEANSSIEVLAEKFDIKEVYQGVRNKLDILKNIVYNYSLTEEEFIYVGDDVNDFDSFIFAIYSVTVPNAVDKIKKIEKIQITDNVGGNGAFREIVDSILYQ